MLRAPEKEFARNVEILLSVTDNLASSQPSCMYCCCNNVSHNCYLWLRHAELLLKHIS